MCSVILDQDQKLSGKKDSLEGSADNTHPATDKREFGHYAGLYFGPIQIPRSLISAAIAAIDAPAGSSVRPTEVQRKCWEKLLRPAQTAHPPSDFIAIAPTGSGKTLAFLLPAIALSFYHHNSQYGGKSGSALPILKAAQPFSLVISPTRELCQQTTHVARQLADRAFGAGKLPIFCAIGGVRYAEQRAALVAAVPAMLVATTGRLLALCGESSTASRARKAALSERSLPLGSKKEQKQHDGQRWCDLSAIKTLVIDEADRMLDLGFADDVISVMRLTKTSTLELKEKSSQKLPSAQDNQLCHDYAQVVRRIYIEHNPAKLPQVPELLLKYKGRERELVWRLVKKYRSNAKNVSTTATASSTSNLRHLGVEAAGKDAAALSASNSPPNPTQEEASNPIKKSVHSMLFSATWTTEASRLASKILAHGSTKIEVSSCNRDRTYSSVPSPPMSSMVLAGEKQSGDALSIPNCITQRVEIMHRSGAPRMRRLLELVGDALSNSQENRAIVFVVFKQQASEVAEALNGAIPGCAVALHGGMSQTAREKAVCYFRGKHIESTVRVLVATDVAARGIDVKGITNVFNFSVGLSIESYVHRVGRCGRGGNNGTAHTFVVDSDAHLAKALVDVLRTSKATVPEDLAIIASKLSKQEAKRIKRNAAVPYKLSESADLERTEQLEMQSGYFTKDELDQIQNVLWFFGIDSHFVAGRETRFAQKMLKNVFSFLKLNHIHSR